MSNNKQSLTCAGKHLIKHTTKDCLHATHSAQANSALDSKSEKGIAELRAQSYTALGTYGFLVMKL